MLRNFALQAVQGEKGYSFYKPLLLSFQQHISIANLALLSVKHAKLAYQLWVLKLSLQLFWKKFGVSATAKPQ